MTRLSSGNGWLPATVALFLLSLLLAVSYTDTFMPVVGAWNQWSDGEYYAHGYLVLLMSLYIVYHERRQLAARTPSPGVAGILAVAATVVLWTVAELIHVKLLSIMALLFMIASVLWAMLGWSSFRVLFVPVFILIFALPVWSPLPPLLQVITADAVFAMSRMAGLPVFQDGFLLLLPAGTLEVETSCSGLSYLLAALTLGTFYGWMFYRSLMGRFLAVVVTGLAAIVANILRVFIVAYVGYKTDMQHPMIYDHFYLGWYLFGGLVLSLMVIDALFLRGIGKAGVPTDPATTTMPSRGSGIQRIFVAMVSVAILLAAGPMLVNYAGRSVPDAALTTLHLPAGIGGWSGPLPSAERWEPVYHGAVTKKYDYHKGGKVVTLYLGLYARQQQGHELVYYNNRIAEPDIWREMVRLENLSPPQIMQVREHRLVSTDGQRRIVWSWYRVAGRTTTSRYMVKLLQVAGLLTGTTRAAVVAVATDGGDDVEAARRRLGDFVTIMNSQLMDLADGRSK